MLTGKKILVTGASGFVGGHLANRLLDVGAQLTILARESSDREKINAFRERGANISIGDITKKDDVLRAVQGQALVFHCAALYREARFPDELYFQVNTEGTRNLLEACLEGGVQTVVHTSTTGVHSHIEHPPAVESEPYHPTDVYQVSKTEAEKLARSYFESGRLAGVILRPAMIWGEGDRRILKLFRGIAHRKLPLIGDGRTWTHWIYVQDLVNAYLLAAGTESARGKIFFIAGRRPVQMGEVYETIARIAGVKLLPFRIPARPLQVLGSVVETLCRPFGIEPPLHRRRVDFFVKNRCFDTTRARTVLGFSPLLDFEEEARRVFTWYKEHNWL